MKKAGFIAGALGVVVIVAAYGFDTAPEGTYNIGLLQEQMMFFGLGCLLVLCGAVVGGLGYALERMERAGLLPSAEYNQTPEGSAGQIR